MSVLKIMHIISGGEFGGAERHILNLASSVNPRLIDTTVCCLFSAPFFKIAADAGVNVFVIPMRSKFDLGIVGKLVDNSIERDIDIIHTHGVRANLLGRLAARQAGQKKVVTTIHSLLERDYPNFLTRQINCWTERLTRNWSDHFIAVSDGLKNQLIARGVPEDKVTVIHNGIVLEEFSAPEEPDTFRKRLGLDPMTPLVGIVARLHAVKGHYYFLQAAREILSQQPDVRFMIVGDGPYRSFLEGEARRMGIAGQVIFTGFVDDVRSLMASLNLLVISSLWEGFGLTAIEAMTIGLPVLATDVGGLPEVVRHGETGFLVPPADAAALAKGIMWLLNHPANAEELAKRGLEVVRKEFTADKMARRTEELYRRLAGCNQC